MYKQQDSGMINKRHYKHMDRKMRRPNDKLSAELSNRHPERKGGGGEGGGGKVGGNGPPK